MSHTQADKVGAFRRLHQAGCFVIGNVWDAGTARMLAAIGYPALATSSGAAAGTLGRRDGQITRAEALAHAAAVVNAVNLPVSADLENGFGHTPEDAAETVRQAAAIGLAGCTIEDTTGDPADPIYDPALALARIRACVAAARAAPHGFVLTARAENFLRGRPDLDDTIARLRAYADAGADVLMAPGLPSLDAVRTVCSALDKPFNFMAGIPGKSFNQPDLAAAGVRRISLATSLWRAAMTGVVVAARSAAGGDFGYIDSSLPSAEIVGLLG